MLLLCMHVQVSEWERLKKISVVCTQSCKPRVDPFSGFSIATSDGSSRLPLRVISLERRSAHPAIKYDCAGEPVGKPASSSIWCRSSNRFVAVRGYDTPSL